MAGFDFKKLDNFYVYFHRCPLTNEIRYVRKGRNKRAYSLTDRASKHKNWLNSLFKKELLPIIEIFKDNLLEVDALKLEEDLIKEYRELGYNLNNIHSKGGAYTPKKEPILWHKGKFGKDSIHYGRKRTNLTKKNQSIAQHKKILERNGGTYLFKKINKWHVRITVLGKRKHIGYYDTKEEALEVYKTELNKLQLK